MEKQTPSQRISESEAVLDVRRRSLLGGGTVGIAIASIGAIGLLRPETAQASGISGWVNVMTDYGATGNGSTDDTSALRNAIAAGSSAQVPIFFPPGTYKTTSSLAIPSNTMIVGSSPGLGFGCILQPTGCPAFDFGGATSSFQCSVENLVIWPLGTAPDHVISIDNCYSLLFRNIKIYTNSSSWSPTTASLLLLGNPSVGGTGHGSSNNIIWDNLVIRSDGGQPGVAILAQAGCGTHRFIVPDLENYGILFQWQGGQIELFQPYTERAGTYCLNCNVNKSDTTAYMNTFGGLVSSSPSGAPCGIQFGVQNLNSFGTQWNNPSSNAISIVGLPTAPVTFHGVSLASGSSGPQGISGPGNVAWQSAVRIPDLLLRAGVFWNVTVPSIGQAMTTVTVQGVQQLGNGVSNFWARATFSNDLSGLTLSAYVSAANTVKVVALNNTSAPISVQGNLLVECGWL